MGLGELNSKIIRWKDIPSGECNYYFEVQENTQSEAFLNSAESLTECPTDLELSFTAQSDNMVVAFSSDALVPQAELTAGLRPFDEAQKRQSVDALDILNVRLGMTIGEATSILEEAGFEEASNLEGLRTGETYQLRTAVFGRDPKDQSYNDIVALALTSEPIGQRYDGLVKGISRHWKISPSQNLASATLKSALTEKYGSAESQFNENRDCVPPCGVAGHPQEPSAFGGFAAGVVRSAGLAPSLERSKVFA